VIVDGQFTYDLTLGQDRRISQDGDAQTVIPNTILPVALVARPTRILSASANTQTSSFMISINYARTNQGSGTDLIAVITPGLWEFELLLMTLFDYTGAAGAFNGFQIAFQDVLTISHTALMRLAAPGSFTDFNRLRVLAKENLNLNTLIGATTVGQHADARVAVNAIRII
jgi:hypothetical protein